MAMRTANCTALRLKKSRHKDKFQDKGIEESANPGRWIKGLRFFIAFFLAFGREFAGMVDFCYDVDYTEKRVKQVRALGLGD